MNSNEIIYFVILTLCSSVAGQVCSDGRSVTFVRWSGVTSERAPPVFVYTASGEEDSLVGACLAQCRELEDCAAVVVAYGKGNCVGVANTPEPHLRTDHDVTYFKKICLHVSEECSTKWWALESTPGYHLHSESAVKVLPNSTIQDCYDSILSARRTSYRSGQWVGPDGSFNAELIQAADSTVGSCLVNAEDKFTEPESYRVSNYYTFYIENQCKHDYLIKIDRCSYEEYNNQTLRHVEFTLKNRTKDECKKACETEQKFICRGFSWISKEEKSGVRGICDLHSEDLVTTGSWLLRKTSGATYYRRVICLNISVDCDNKGLNITYKPRGVFRGRMYVPGKGEQCGARGKGGPVKLTLPMHGECDVNFAYGISNGPTGVINRTMAYVMVMIQNNPIIQTAGDRWVRVGCSPGPRTPTHVDATLAVTDNGRAPATNSGRKSWTGAASAVVGGNAPLRLYVVRAETVQPPSAAVSLGEPLELRLETTDTSEIQPYYLVASSRLGDSSVVLLDSKGCPTGQVDFPAFTRTWLDGTQRLSVRFKAFRFPTSHIVRFALMVRFCEDKCEKVDCMENIGRITRDANVTYFSEDTEQGRVVAQGGTRVCHMGVDDPLTLELELAVDSKGIQSSDALVRADHRSSYPEESRPVDGVVCVHELLLVALALTWLAVQLLLLLGCCVLVKRYRNLAEMSMQKDYHSFDNVGFDTVSTHRRVHWPDQNIDILHAT
ncbi:uncharacterized protein LOC101747119 isoform X2 [Bombyx mori]|uniref:Uncharacterized protein n=1 Tax=Bombyx mori TaxID=7091 RepID=A0A8R2C695_BOMMO|nr:uncharacterized protein LOC101747119 isoform X2 [Bombyx mori]